MTTIERALLLAIMLVVVVGVVVIAGRRVRALRHLARMIVALVFGLVVLGAYVRLSDAGLGCPDWPGCYGDLSPATALDHIRSAEAAAPHGPVTLAKAWKEMGHRYLAMLVGCLIVALNIVAWRCRRVASSSPSVALLLLVVVSLQGAFGALTVTLKLMPVVVTLHLLGGMLTLLLATVYVGRIPREDQHVNVAREPGIALWARFGLLILFIQIALGGWVSTNYAAPVCGALPGCQGELWPSAQFSTAFELFRPLGMSSDGQALPLSALTAIHLAHRSFAVVVAVILLTLAFKLWRRGWHALAAVLMAGLVTQIALGLKVVWTMSAQHLDLAVQLPTAAAHNAVAASLVILLTVINFERLAVRSAPRRAEDVAPLRAVYPA